MTSEPAEHISDLRDRLEKVEGKIRQRRKDFWDKFQILAAMLTPAAIALVGVLMNLQLADNQRRLKSEAETRQANQLEQQKREETTKLVLDVISGRELADTQIRAQMFESLLTHYFGEQSAGPRDRLTLLHLMQTNFVEYFNARPLFEALHQEIAGTDDEESIKHQMRKIARGIVDRQEMLVDAGSEALLELPIRDPESDDGFQPLIFGGHRMEIRVTAVDDDKAHVELKWMSDEMIDFDVNYYDMPLVDYTTLADGHRFALTFKGWTMEDGQVIARLKAFEFKGHRLLPRDRPTMDMVYKFVKDLRNEVEAQEGDHSHDDEDGEPGHQPSSPADTEE